MWWITTLLSILLSAIGAYLAPQFFIAIAAALILVLITLTAVAAVRGRFRGARRFVIHTTLLVIAMGLLGYGTQREHPEQSVGSEPAPARVEPSASPTTGAVAEASPTSDIQTTLHQHDRSPSATTPSQAFQGATPEPTPMARVIQHTDAETMVMPGSSARDKRAGQLALQIEKAVRWSPDSDPNTAGKADGTAALDAFHQMFKASPVPVTRKKTRTATESTDELKEEVCSILMADASDSFRQGPEPYQTYQSAFESAFKRDEATQAGREPLPSIWDGHIGLIDDYIKDRINDPDSYRFVRCWKPQLTKVNGQWSWRVKYVFRAKNAFGGVITEIAFVTIRDGQVVGFELEQ